MTLNVLIVYNNYNKHNNNEYINKDNSIILEINSIYTL